MQFPCFGLSFLGQCAYNPAQPSPTYFTIGDAVAALAFTLAVGQLFKPIHLFRLRAHGLKILHLSATVFLGAACAIVAAVLPNTPIEHRGMLEYPIFWEVVGGMFIFVAYGFAAWITLRPAGINAFNLATFVRAAASFLSEASDDDRVSFARDLLTRKNLKRVFRYATAWEKAAAHASMIEFDRLRERGEQLTITGRPKPSAFYLFAHRGELAAASDAITLLQVMSDPDFCAVLVRKCPWLTAAMLDGIARDNLRLDQAEPFVQEIARQALLNDDSMLAKEVGYTGFGTVPYLSQTLFGNWFILNQYDPVNRVGFNTPNSPSQGFAARLNKASKLMLDTAIKGGSYWGQRYIYGVQGVYENLFRHWSYTRPNPLPVEYAVTLHMGIADLYKMMRDALRQMKSERRKSLFVKEPKQFKNDIVDALACIIYESLTCVTNDFKGANDNAWFHVIGVFTDLYPQFSSEPTGMDPLQQHLALKLIDKLTHNMNGWYPAISRILLVTIGPYATAQPPANRTAFVILKEAVYRQLQKLPALHSKNPEKLPDYLPPTVTFDPATNSLTHTYSGGQAVVTCLSDLQVPEIDLCAEQNYDLTDAADVPADDY
jgi:hypothetical protein